MAEGLLKSIYSPLSRSVSPWLRRLAAAVLQNSARIRVRIQHKWFIYEAVAVVTTRGFRGCGSTARDYIKVASSTRAKLLTTILFRFGLNGFGRTPQVGGPRRPPATGRTLVNARALVVPIFHSFSFARQNL